MGLLKKLKSWWQQRTITQELEEIFPDEGCKSESVDMNDSMQRDRYVKTCIEQMAETTRQLENMGKEYDLVTTYLTDMERIEEMPEAQREQLDTFAKQILDLEESYLETRDRESIISAEEYARMEQLEEEMPKAYQKIKEAEDYRVLVKRDLAKLDGEKHAFAYRKAELINEQRNMKGMTAICLGAMFLLVLILCMLNMYLGLEVTLGYVICVLIAASSLTLLYVKYHEAAKELIRIDKANNKLILLHNTVKIRYVNNTNLLDYLYAKYQVQSAKSLKKMWDSYVTESNMRQQETQVKNDLELAKSSLLRILRRNRLEAPNIWPYQVKALIDEHEMSQLRHDLIIRRQKLRKQMEYNARLCEDAQGQVQQIAQQYPAQAVEILDMLTEYQKAI